MVWVNLLPWRQAGQRRRWRFWRLLSVLVCLALCTVVLSGQWQRQLNQQQAAALAQWAGAQRAAAALNDRWLAMKMQSEQRQQQWEHQQQRQRQVMQWVAFSHRLGAILPADVWLTSLTKTPQSLTIRGVGRHIQPLFQLRERLADIPSLDPVALGPLQRTRTGEMTFDMQAELTPPEVASQ